MDGDSFRTSPFLLQKGEIHVTTHHLLVELLSGADVWEWLLSRFTAPLLSPQAVERCVERTAPLRDTGP